MSKQYQVTYDYAGDLSVHAGWASSYDIGPVRCGPVGKHEILTDAATGRLAVESDAVTYLGGSGRNLTVTGIPIGTAAGSLDYNGVWAHGYPGQYIKRDWKFKTDASLGLIITDGTGTIATGQTIGFGGYGFSSTAYGQTLLGATAPFNFTFYPEYTEPGTLPKADLMYGPAGLPLGQLNPMADAAHYTSAVDSRLTISIDEDGVASMAYDATIIAIRDGGPNNHPEGTYYNTPAGQKWNPTPLQYSETQKYATNPYGILTLAYSWPATPDLDTTTIFAGGKVGYPGPYTAPYMLHSGDNQSPSGTETVTINLAAAWIAGILDAPADILCHADWYPGGSSGPATLTVTYSLPGFVTQVLTIQPGNIKPGSTTRVAALRVGPDGLVTQSFSDWQCGVETRWVPTPAGTVYVAAQFSNIRWNGAAPTLGFGPVLPPISYANPVTTICYPIAVSDGEYIEQIHTGDLSFSNTKGY
jgi:hypothetical protein